jgi:FAD-linked sulfhydryl oxidase
MWFMFHVVAATYPVKPTTEDRTRYAAFYASLQHVLPCEGCRKGYQTILASDPTRFSPRIMDSRYALFKWTVDVHNRVNAKLGKPVDPNWRAWYKEYDKLRK